MIKWFLISLRAHLRDILFHHPSRLLALLVVAGSFWAIEVICFARLFGYLLTDFLPEYPQLGNYLALHLLHLLFLVIGVMLAYSSLVTAITVFLTASDMPYLLTLPIPNWKLYTRKYLETVLRSSGLLATAIVPILLTYGYYQGFPLATYGPLLLGLLCYVQIPPLLAIPLVLMLAGVFPTRRIQQILVVFGVSITTLALFGFRLLRLEDVFSRSADPGEILRFINRFKLARQSWNPSSWLTHTIEQLSSGNLRELSTYQWLFWLMLITASGFLVSCLIGSLLLRKSWERSQTSQTEQHRSRSGTGFPGKFETTPWRAVIIKEMRVFSRDLSRWSQLVMLLPLVAFYLMNLYLLPFQEHFRQLYYLLNLFMIAFMTAAFGARYLFPAISWEGTAIYLIKTAPISLHRLVLIKLVFYTLPLLAAMAGLLVISFLLLDFPFRLLPGAMLMSMSTSALIACLGIGMGALLPRFRYEHHLEISLGPGGLTYMFVSLLVCLAYLLVMAAPILFVLKFDIHGWFFWKWDQIVPPANTTMWGWSLLCLATCCVVILFSAHRLNGRESLDQ